MMSNTKRSTIIGGRPTSLSLEDEFFAFLTAYAKKRGVTFKDLVAEVIEASPERANVSSALRVYALKIATGRITLKPSIDGREDHDQRPGD